MSTVERGYEAAFAAAQLSDAPRSGLKMGACLMAGSRILSVGCNLYKRSHPDSQRSMHFICSTHAEHMAILRRQHYGMRSRLTLYVARRRADGTIGNSKPCVNCLKLCILAGVSRVWYYENGIAKELAL